MKWNDMIHRGGAWTRTFLVATALVTTACVTGCGGDDTAPSGPEDTGAPDTGQADTGTPDTNVPDTNVADTNVVDSGQPDTTPQPFTATPQFTPPPQAQPFTAAVSVQISDSTSGAVIYYTTDGTTPNTSSPTFTSAIQLTTSGTTVIKAMALAPGHQESAIATATYVVQISGGTLATPTPSPQGGTYNNDTLVSLTTNQAGATICYTLDGSAPACDKLTATCQGSSQTYSTSSRVLINATNTTLNAIACKVGFENSMPFTTPPVYKLQGAPTTATPPPPATAPLYAFGTTADVGTATTGSTVHVTRGTPTNPPTAPTCFTSTTIGTAGTAGGTEPPGSPSPGFSSDEVIMTIVCKPNYDPSPVTTHIFHVRPGTPSAQGQTTAGSSLASPTTGNTVVACSGGSPCNVSPGLVNNDVSFALTAGNGETTGDICYTLNGTTAPTCDLTTTALYGSVNSGACGTGSTKVSTTAPAITANTAHTLQMIACPAGLQPSLATPAATYTLTVGANAGVVVRPDPATTNLDNTGHMTVNDLWVSTAGRTTCYRLNNAGTTPAACDATNTANGGCAAGSSPFTQAALGTASASAFTVQGPPAATSSDIVSVISCKAGYTSAQRSFSYSGANAVGSVQFSPDSPPGTPAFNNQVNLVMSATNATVICYNVANGSTPTAPVCPTSGTDCTANGGNGTSYIPGTTGPVLISNQGFQITAIGCGPPTYGPSQTKSATYQFVVANPSISPTTASVGAGVLPVFSTPTLTQGSSSVVAPVIEFHYTRGTTAAPPPDPTCFTGTTVPAASVTNTCNLAACTLGAQPTEASGQALDPVDATHTVFKVIACDKLAGNFTGFGASQVTPRTYSVVAQPPTFSPQGSAGGNTSVTNAITVNIASATNTSTASGATLCYTTDGSTPDCNASTVCTVSVGGTVSTAAIGPTGVNVNLTGNPADADGNVTASTRQLKAVVCAPGMPTSTPVTSDSYQFDVTPIKFTGTATGTFSGSAASVGIAYNPNTTDSSTLNDAAPTGSPAAVICYTTVSTDTPQCAYTAGVASCLTSGTTTQTYTGTPITFTTTTTIKAIACRPGYNQTAVLPGTWTATPYSHSINIDGVNDFSASDIIGVYTASPQGSTTAYFSWDATPGNLYFGFTPTTVDNATTDYYDVYIGFPGATGPAESTTNGTGNYPFSGTLSSTYKAAWHIRYRMDGGDTGVTHWNGSAWVNAGITVTVATGTAGYVEFKVPISSLTGITASSTLDLVGGLVASGARSGEWPNATQYREINLSQVEGAASSPILP